MIDVIFTDIDGCFVPQHYDPSGSIQVDEGSEYYFEYYRRYSGPQLVLCTGRAWVNTLGILRRAEFMPHQRSAWPDRPLLCENGADLIIDPIAGQRTSLIDAVDAYSHLRPAVEHIQNAGREMGPTIDQVHEQLELEFGRKINPIDLVQKEYSVTVRIPCFAGTADQIDAARFRQAITRAIQELLGWLLRDGAAQVVQSTSAVDITLPIGKGDGVKYVLDKYGTPPNRAAYIGDSVPDIDGMKQVHLACCPTNADPTVKAFVASLGDRGYTSSLAFADAEIDILNYIRLRSQ
jgi:hydroxymethylpyrimidine pyrophosphatase-like HAD family hydrolase